MMLSSQSESHTKYKDPVEELDEYMDNVLSNTGELTSFDEFLEKLKEEISKDA